jgi:outer membrane protein assembly factor BamB
MHPQQRTALLLLGLGIILGSTCAPADAADWSRFRGPNGTGAVTGQDLPVEWKADDILWKTPVPGKGHSSPVVWGDNVFLQSASADATERWLFCVSASTGKVLWKQTTQGSKGGTHPLSSLASGTPAVDGERVYTIFWDGKNLSLNAYDLKGVQQWRRDLGSFKSQHGAGHSPIVYDGKVYVADDQDGSAVLYAFDARTGEPAWKVERPAFRACYSTPFVLEKPNEPSQLIVLSTAGLTAYNPKDGKEIWNFVWAFDNMPLRTVGSPVIADGMAICPSGDGSGERNMIAVRLGGTGDVTKTNLAWQIKARRDTPYVPCMLSSGPYLFAVNDFGVTTCYVAKTGEKVWSEALFGDTPMRTNKSAVSASPVLIDGKIYVIDLDGKVCVFEAASKFKLLAKNSVGEPVAATPAVADGRLFVRGSEHLFCIGKPKK